ncbi:MAG: M48 family metallopeptidase [Candidatus Methylomirabilales bacterium]
MKTDWQGHYLDGRTPVRQRAAIRLMRNGLEITTEGGTRLWWPYEGIRQTQGFYVGEEVRLEVGSEVPQALLVSDTAFLNALHHITPEHAARFHDPARRRWRMRLTTLAALAVVGITITLYLWGIPALAAVVASRVPVSWEERLGHAVIEHLAPPSTRCTDPSRTWVIDEIVSTLTDTLRDSPYTFRVFVVNNPTVNAFAAPGGYIVLFSGLVEHTRNAEELAGVIAHELQHIVKRHSTRMLLQNASTGLLLAAVTGSGSDAMAFGLEGARILGLLQYSRLHEEEADREGIRMLLAARVDPAGMITFFELLQKEAGRAPEFLKYLSTHPSIGDRITRLELLVKEADGQPVNLLPNHDWRKVRSICQETSQSPGVRNRMSQEETLSPIRRDLD